MYWNACLNGDCNRFEKPTQERKCPVCGEPTSGYEPTSSAPRLQPANENARRVAERRRQWSEATGVPLAATVDIPFAATLTENSRSAGASAWNYLWLLVGLVGGIVGNLLVRDEDPAMAKRLLLGGLAVTLVCFIPLFAV